MATSGDKVIINVGGKKFLTYSSTLQRVPGSLLAKIDSEHPSYDREKKEYFFDRNPQVFNSLLDYYRTGELHFSSCLCGPAIRKELSFWEIDDTSISSCCWRAFTAYEDELTTLKELDRTLNTTNTSSGSSCCGGDSNQSHYCSAARSLMRKIWIFLDKPHSSRVAQVWAIFFNILILISILVVGMETHPMFRVIDESKEGTVNSSNPKVTLYQTSRSHSILELTDGICACIFTVELLLRFICCPTKFRFVKSFYNITDVFCVLPLVVVFFLQMTKDEIWENSNMFVIIGYLSITSVLRVFRLFKLARHYRGLKILYLAVRSSIRELLLLIMLIFMGMLVFSTMIYFAEFYVQGDFTDIPIGYWWSVITMTTVGYGDVHPQTLGGYIVGAICSICGILITGLPIPIIASNFNHYYSFARLASKLAEKRKRTDILGCLWTPSKESTANVNSTTSSSSTVKRSSFDSINNLNSECKCKETRLKQLLPNSVTNVRVTNQNDNTRRRASTIGFFRHKNSLPSEDLLPDILQTENMSDPHLSKNSIGLNVLKSKQSRRNFSRKKVHPAVRNDDITSQKTIH